MTRFKMGQKVVSLVKAQGLEVGKTYTVTQIQQLCMPFGVFVTYVLDSKFPVGNGHLLLKEAA